MTRHAKHGRPGAWFRPRAAPVVRAVALAAALLSMAGPVVGAAPAAVVTMTDTLKFTPRTVTVPVGATVEWRNASVLVHTVTADPARAAKAEHVALPAGALAFDSGKIKPQATFQHTFAVPGVYRYFCIPHEAANMVGEVIVK